MMTKLLLLNIFIRAVLSEDKYHVVATALYYTSDNGQVLLATGSLPVDTEKTILKDIQERFGNDLPISVVPVYKTIQDVPTDKHIFTLLRNQFPIVYIADIPQSKSRQIMRDMRKYTPRNALLMYMKNQVNKQPTPLKKKNVEQIQQLKHLDLREYLLLARSMNLSYLSDGKYSTVGLIPPDVRQGENGLAPGTGSKADPGEGKEKGFGLGGDKGSKTGDEKGPRAASEKGPGANNEKAGGEKRPRIGDGADSEKGPEKGGKKGSGASEETTHDEKVEQLDGDPSVKYKEYNDGRPPHKPPFPTTDVIIPNDIYYGIELTCANWNNICDDRGPKNLRWVPATYLKMPMIDIKLPRHELSP